MSINRTAHGNPLGYSAPKKWEDLEPCSECGANLPNVGGECAVCGDFDKAEDAKQDEHTCPQCESVDPDWQCDSCEGCDSCCEFCSNNTLGNHCIDCCDCEQCTEERTMYKGAK